MKKRSEKQQDLDNLKTELAKVSTVILTTFQGITVENDTKLRRAVQAAGGKYKVVKNTLAERAGAGTPDREFAEGFERHKFDCVQLERSGSAGKGVDQGSQGRSSVSIPRGAGRRPGHFHCGNSAAGNLPSKEELLSKVMFLLNAPAQRIAMALNALPRNLAITVSEAIKANKFASAGGGSGDAGSGEKSVTPAPEAVPAASSEASPETSPEKAQ